MVGRQLRRRRHCCQPLEACHWSLLLLTRDACSRCHPREAETNREEAGDPPRSLHQCPAASTSALLPLRWHRLAVARGRLDPGGRRTGEHPRRLHRHHGATTPAPSLAGSRIQAEGARKTHLIASTIASPPPLSPHRLHTAAPHRLAAAVGSSAGLLCQGGRMLMGGAGSGGGHQVRHRHLAVTTLVHLAVDTASSTLVASLPPPQPPSPRSSRSWALTPRPRGKRKAPPPSSLHPRGFRRPAWAAARRRREEAGCVARQRWSPLVSPLPLSDTGDRRVTIRRTVVMMFMNFGCKYSVFFDLCKNLSTFMIFYFKYIITDRSSIKP